MAHFQHECHQRWSGRAKPGPGGIRSGTVPEWVPWDCQTHEMGLSWSYGMGRARSVAPSGDQELACLYQENWTDYLLLGDRSSTVLY